MFSFTPLLDMIFLKKKTQTYKYIKSKGKLKNLYEKSSRGQQEKGYCF